MANTNIDDVREQLRAWIARTTNSVHYQLMDRGYIHHVPDINKARLRINQYRELYGEWNEFMKYLRSLYDCNTPGRCEEICDHCDRIKRMYIGVGRNIHLLQ